MSRWRSRLRAASAVLALVVLLVSCAPAFLLENLNAPGRLGERLQSYLTPVPAPDQPRLAQTAVSLTPTPVAVLARDQVIRLPAVEPATLDPSRAQDASSVSFIVNLFEGLLEFDADGNAQPIVAQSWEISPDGRVYTFRLRQGPRWSDGRPVTAGDFEYAWKRKLTARTASPYVTTLYLIKGAEAYHTGLSSDPAAVGVRAIDDSTLVVELTEPAAHFLRLVGTWMAMPLPRHVVEQHGERWTEPGHIVTNGPFQLETRRPAEAIVLVRNEQYWGAKPALARAEYRIFAESDQTPAMVLAAYVRGDLDSTGGIPLPIADYDRIKRDARLSKELRTHEVSGTYFLVVNSAKPPFDHKGVRKALYLVIDPQRILDLIGAPGRPARGLAPPGILGRDPAAYPAGPNAALARELLAQAGYPSGHNFPPFTYVYNTAPGHRAIAEYLRDVWSRELGLRVTIEQMEWREFLKWRGEAAFDIYRGGWISDYEDPHNWYNMLLDSRFSDEMFRPGWQHAEFDRLIRQARHEVDTGQREALYQQADRILADELPFLPIYYYGSHELVKPYVDGWNRTRVMSTTYLKHVRIVEP